jgi:glyoxylase-like metal-dependent hydrolase (beta-lactamase superfamily II)
MIEVQREQRPIGQGGFHTCSVMVKRHRFDYVYDCGSMQKQALERETDAYSEEIGVGRSIDLLALSHLDDDHVNGVERLLASHDASTVLLPYLHPWDRLLLVAEACARGHLTEIRLAGLPIWARVASSTPWDRGRTGPDRCVSRTAFPPSAGSTK